MGALLSFFSGPAQLKALLLGAGVCVLACLSLLTYALWWRGEAFEARAALEKAHAERDLAIAQGRVLAGGLQACNAGVDQAKQISDAAIVAMGELLDKARKLAGPREKTIERIETVIHQAPQPGEGCDWAWDKLEADHRGRPQ